MKRSETSIRSNNLEIGYKRGNPVFGTLNITVRSGEVTCLMGPNGVGKSTLVKTLLGILPPLSGELFLDGKPITTWKAGDIAKKIAVVFTDRISKGNLTVKELVLLGRIPHTGWLGKIQTEDRNAVTTALADVRISHLSDSPLSELSDGQLQKALIARALAQDGNILILDEPTAHLDVVNRYEIMYLLRELAVTKHKAILVVTHDLDIVLETADQLLLMVEERLLIKGTPEDLVIRGEINRLIPGDALHFDLLSGKIGYKRHLAVPNVSGPAQWIPWVQSILIKHSIPVNHLSIELKNNPFAVRIKLGHLTQEVYSLEEMIAFLSDNQL